MTGDHAGPPPVPAAGTVPPATAAALTRGDRDVLAALAAGRSTAEIAALLSVSRNTARTRIRRVRAKLDVGGREAAVRAARDLGVLPAERLPDPPG
ncbi:MULTISPECIES: response regulator transcription factor [unclassified Blastococcus]